MALRRGFAVAPGEAALICENTVTTGGSVREVVDLLRRQGAEVIGVAVYGDRSSDPSTVFDVPYIALVRLEFASWSPRECPLCRDGGQPESPGSRHLGK